MRNPFIIAAAASSLAVSGMASAQQTYAEVISRTPIYRDVKINEPRQECRDEQVVTTTQSNPAGGVIGTVLGGVVGAVVGSQIGRGGGRTVATAGGAVVGAVAGNAVGNSTNQSQQVVQDQTRCRTVVDSHYEQRPDGYDVAYRYGGQTYHTRLSYDPGPQLPINVSVTPAGTPPPPPPPPGYSGYR